MLDNFDHFLILVNPASTGIQQTKRRISELRTLVPERSIKLIEMSGKGREANSKLLSSKAAVLGPRTLLCIAAGDGSASLMVETLIRDKAMTRKARETPVLPLWGGNANDLANMLNGSAAHAQLHHILNNGRVIPIYPLTFQITNKDGLQQTRIAVCNASFGATAYVAKRLNEASYRQSQLHKIPGGRLLKETTTAVGTLLKAPTFVAEDEGLRKIIYERTFSNGSRFAKLYQMPVKLNDKRFYLHTIEGKRFVVTALQLSASFRRRSSIKDLHHSLNFVIHEKTLAQFDGETLSLAAGTKVTAEMSKLPFYAVSTVLTH